MARHDELTLLRGELRKVKDKLADAHTTIRTMKNEPASMELERVKQRLAATSADLQRATTDLESARSANKDLAARVLFLESLQTQVQILESTRLTPVELAVIAGIVARHLAGGR